MNHITYVAKHPVTYSVSRHAHHDWELIYCTSGYGQFGFDDGVIPYTAGEIVVIPPPYPAYQ